MKKLIKELNLNYKKERLTILGLTLAFICAGVTLILLNYTNIAILMFCAPMVVILFKYWHYTSLKERMIMEREDEFISLVNYLEIFLSNKFNVYNGFLALKQYSSVWMSNKIQELLDQIDEDKSVEPFIKFAHNFKTPIIENVMVSLYQMVEEGEGANQLSQFDILFQRFNENHHLANINKKIRSIDSLSVFPLIGAAIVTIILTFGIISIMGEIINVI